MQHASSTCSAASSLSMLRPYILAVLHECEKVPSKQEGLLYESGPLASILLDRNISSIAHSHVSCTSFMSTVRISSAKGNILEESASILGLLSFSAHCEGRFLPSDCPINQPPAYRGSFLVPVTTSDCLGCNSSTTSTSQQLIIVLS